jgi:hypothetical protein
MLNICRFRQKGDRRDKRFKRDIRGHDGVDWNLKSIKINIPFFHWKHDPKTFLEWKIKVKLIFYCHDCSEEKKKLAMIEDYFKVMEVVMIWVKIEEDRETTMIKFLNDLNREITNIIELQHHIELKDMVYMATKVKRKLNKKDNSKPSQNFSLFSSW